MITVPLRLNGAFGEQPEPLEIGLAVIDKPSTGLSYEAAAQQLVQQALGMVHIDRLPVRCILLLATADWCQGPSSFPREVRSAVERYLGYPVPLIGGSMARLFCSMGPERFIEKGVIMVAFCSRDLWTTVVSLEEPHRKTETERRNRVQQMADYLEHKAGIRLGASANRHLLGIFPGIMLNTQGQPVYYDNELHEEVLAAFGYSYRLIGGAAADDLKPTVGYQFANDECLKSGLALALIETDLAWGTMMGHGFEPDWKTLVSVDALTGGANSGYEVSVLDGKPAAVRIDELKRESSAKCGELLFGLPAGPDDQIVCPLYSEIDAQGAVRFNRKLRLGDRLHVVDTSSHQMAESSQQVVRSALRMVSTERPCVTFIWELSCTGRFHIYEKLGLKWQDVVDYLKKDYPGIPLVGALCAGEFGIDPWQRAQANNFSFWVCCISARCADRAKTRFLLGKLLAAADRLTACQTQREVMEAALTAAVTAGSTGGQICIVDYAIGRILGLNLGFAFCPPDSPHRWPEVLKKTNRSAPHETGGDFPRYLLNWAMPIGQDLRLKVVAAIPLEDILTLIVRTRCAVFVEDYRNPCFHCDAHAAEAGRIFTFIAIPLIGSSGRAIATMQLSFPDHSLIDHDSFCLWVGYGQKVSAALERAQETEERNLIQQISTMGNTIMQVPAAQKESPCDWGNKYLEAVIRLLGADGAHMRILRKGPGGEQYLLVSAIGHLSELRYKTRLITQEAQGSCNRQLLESGGCITNTREETNEIHKNVHALKYAEEYGEQFDWELKAIACTAMLPLRYEGKVLGTFVIYSKQPYFFTERRARIARAAADLAGAILSSKLAAYAKLHLETEMNWMMNRIAAAKEGAATQGLKGLVAHLTSALWADVASLFIWHDAPKELILHTAHGWYRPSEGKASYKIGQGWTGRLAVGNQDVNIVGFEDDELRTEATNPYYENMIPPEHRSPSEEPDARIGIRLKAGDKLVGIISFSYYRENRHLVGDEDSRKYIVNYLTAVIPLITEAVEVAKREANQKQTERLRATKDAVVHKLIEAIDIASGWQPTLDTIRAGFEVERVILYLVKHDRVEFGRVSSIKSEDRAWEPEQPVEPYEALASVIYRGKPFLAKAADEPLLTTWPNRIGIKSLFAVPILSARGEIVGILEMVNRVPTPDHPFEFLAQDECNAAVDVAQSLGVAMEHEAAVAEVRNQLEMANRIGATSLASAIVMHRLMSPLARLRSCIDWLDLQPQRPRDEINSVLTRMQRDCEEAIETIQQTAISGPAERRREDLRGILNQALRVVAPQVSFSRVNLNLTNEFRLPVNVEVFSLVGALVNLLSNAIEAMEQGQTLAVSTQRGLDEKSANLRIHNPGRQYSEKELDEFFKVGHTMKGSQGHLGYGLSIAKRAIEASGGKLILLSPASGGVEARVTLPLAGD